MTELSPTAQAGPNRSLHELYTDGQAGCDEDGAAVLGGAVSYSRWRDCHFADTPSPYLLKRLLMGEDGAAE